MARRQAVACVLACPDPRPQTRHVSRPFTDGEVIVLVDKVGRRHRVRLRAGERHSIHSGLIQHDDLIGRPEGIVVTTQLGARLLAVRPTFAEQVTGRRRQTQPIYPKDLGAILIAADLYPGAHVLEAGTGTGALTMAALRAVGERGSVVSYEVREEFLEAATRAVVDTLGSVPGNLTLKLGDVYAGIEESDMDRVLLDLAEPWQAVPHVKAALRPGGIVFAHCPNVSQVQRFFDCLREVRGFGMLEAFELLQRGWTVRGRSMRPSHRMVAHTGFLCFARRIDADELFEPEGEGFR
ncbi:MAG: tRNA (adenine-N1)-methyltransferase [Chloroflexi bacterium]|nr:MAG: tRNA (adenine-N1)-methyltransferase [Chloroflexota bacterium]TMG01684.1 MAG: tRNA (adenine-N1)-methyltransferase [Chloroflexota bacterium]TMG19924.1 MAG: tRNA (adenine-N1)-methyltransferase [Chloroflexota bacterium]TMG66458.1 MAG: tRNA (adenine-N1)-methyltransferase [Chloroflexota bacterium]